MRRSCWAAGALFLLGCGPALANPVPEAGRFELTLSGGGTYLALPEIRSTFALVDASAEPINTFYDDSGWGAGGSAELAGGLGDIFAIGQPVGISLVGRYSGFSQDDTSTVNGSFVGVAPDGSAAVAGIGELTVSAQQDATLWELTLTLNAPIALGEGWLLRPSIGPSILQFSRSLADQGVDGFGSFLGGNREDLDSFYAGGVVGLDLEADFGGGWSAALGLLGGFYAAHHDYEAAGSGFVGVGGLSQEKSGSAWRGRASLEVAYDLGWVALGVSGGFDYLSEATTLEQFTFLDVALGRTGPPLKADGDLWGVSALATLRVRF